MRNKMKSAREKAGYTQVAAGKLVGKTQSHYGKIERGQIGLRADEALVLCKAFEIDLENLLEVENRESPG